MSETKDKVEFEKLQGTLSSTDVPDDLEQFLLDNLDQQIVDEEKLSNSNKDKQRLASVALVASLFVTVVILTNLYTPVSPIALAYEHSLEEKSMTGFVDTDYPQWMSEHGITVPKNVDAIVLSKNCSIGTTTAKHLRFELMSTASSISRSDISLSGKKAAMNMFVHTAASLYSDMQQTMGEIENQNWLLYKPHKDVTVLVIYEMGLSKKQVNDTLVSMFPNQGKVII